jgi:Zn-dependent metalloprotease
MTCAIVPPHVLHHIAERHDDIRARERARRTLALDAERRGARDSARPAAPSAPSAAPKRAIHDAGQLTTLPGRVVRSEGDAPIGDRAADEVYDRLGLTFDFYRTVFDRDSIDGAGEPLVASVHYGTDYDNAFWDGSQMVYGDGDGHLFATFTGPLEVTAHELTHGVTQHTGALDYKGQSGALNESISDVFGSLVKQFHLGQTADRADWLIGQGIFAPGVQGVALRSMKAPGTAYDDPNLGTDPQPADMAHYVDTADDDGGVHINSGIPNHAFYLAATAIGGHAWEKAGRIWYTTLTSGEVPKDADFATFAGITDQTAGKLFGVRGSERDAVREAWERVGVTIR